MFHLCLFPPKPHKKESKNHSKILPKSIPNLPKLLQHRIEIPNAFQMRPETHFESIFRNFFKFFEGPRPPKIEPRSSKSGKKHLKIDVERKTYFWERILNRILNVFASENGAKINVFQHFFSKTSILWKSLFFLRKIAIFQVSNPSTEGRHSHQE